MKSIEDYLVETNGKGITPKTPKEIAKFKHADLITLPSNVEGTNCGNCSFVEIKDHKKGVGYCKHPDLQTEVTNRMCCAYWTHPDVKRNWKT